MNIEDILTIDFRLRVQCFEGYRDKLYKCPAGVWTIGYGHVCDNKEVDRYNKCPVSVGYLEELFYQDLYLAAWELLALNKNYEKLPIPLLQALTDFVFNLGIGSYKKSTLKQCVDNLKLPISSAGAGSIIMQLERWVYSNGKILRGLQNRRKYEVHLVESCV